MSLTATVRTPWIRARRAWAGTPLQARLVAILLAALIAALVTTALVTQAALRSYLVGQVDQQLQQDAPGVARFASTAQPRFGPIRQLPRGYVVNLWGGEDGTTAMVPATLADPPAFPQLTQDDILARNAEPYTITSSGGQRYRAVAFNLVDAENITVAHAQVAVSLIGVDQSVARARLLVLGFGGIIVVICAVLGWLAIRRSFQPLIQVEETAAAIAAGDLSRRIPERPRTTEVGRLTASLNGMLTQIESAFRARAASEERTRRFAADASHELRTPLAAIRGFAELYRQGAVPADDVPRTMQRIEDEARRMGGLVEDLLLLARLDAKRPAKAEPVDLAVLAGDAVHDARGLAPDRTVRLVGIADSSGPVPAVVIGDEGHLRQVVTNLVGNAVRHTPAGAPIEVAVGATQEEGAHQAVLEVRDHGPGLRPGDAERVFERFYRLDSSRQRGTGGGSGLGLSIVAAVTTAHGGTVQALPTPGGGATFRVTLPLAAVPAPAV